MNADWEDELMVHGYPESGPGSLSIEDLYRMFKERLEKEGLTPNLPEELEPER